MSKFCVKCGKEMDDTARSCPNCGAVIGGMVENRSIGTSIILSILTCGIYGYYWNYKVGKKLYEAGKMNNMDISDNSVLYIVLSIFGLSIVNYCIIQSDLNRFSN